MRLRASRGGRHLLRRGLAARPAGGTRVGCDGSRWTVRWLLLTVGAVRVSATRCRPGGGSRPPARSRAE